MYIGIDIGGTAIKYGLVDAQGTVTEIDKCKTDHSLSGLLERISSITKNFQEKYEIEGIGISAPGIVQSDGFMTTGGAIQELYGVDFKNKMEEAVQLPVFVENDANAAAVAEHWIGNAQGIANYICMVIGTGMGGGIIINNEIYRGAHGMAGEFGWMVTRNFPEMAVIEEASLNKTASVIGGICNQYNQLRPEDEPIYSAEAIMKLAAENDETATKVMADFYQNLSIGLMNLISCFDPEVVLIGGGISENPEFMEKLTAKLKESEENHGSISFLMGKTIAEVKPVKLKNSAGLVGAVYQLRKQLAKK